MIKLIVHSDSQNKSFTFDQAIIQIGSAGDLNLAQENLKPTHLQITKKGQHYYIQNVANDPFCTINHLPFGKKEISNQDLIQIGKTKIQVILETGEEQKEEPDALALLEAVEALDAKPSINQGAPSKRVPRNIENDNSQQTEEESNLQESRIEDFSKNKVEKSSVFLFKKPNWRAFVAICIAVILIISSAATAVYLKAYVKSHRDQVIAAEGVSDVAMALTYARVNKIKPQKQNWFDPDFIKNNLASVLSSHYPSFANINNQGQFGNCPYILRIYTSRDLSHFLVIAQPAPTLLQWLTPKSTIVLDSTDMQLRQIEDVKPLNRLLVNPDTLEGTNANEILNAVRQGSIIPLSSLGVKKGFSPPKALNLIRPGAENFIYNSPRYFHFGEALLKKAANLLQMVGNSHEIVRLQQQLSELVKFPDLVLYSSQGMQKALHAQKALTAIAPQYRLLVAYLSFDTEGMVASSHLLFHEGHRESAIAMSAENVTSETQHVNKHPQEADKGIDKQHPLFLQLSSLAHDRRQALEGISDDLITLLNQRNQGAGNDFSLHLKELVTQYEEMDSYYQKKVTEGLDELYREYADMIPLVHFISYVKAAGLGSLAKEGLKARASELKLATITHEQVTNQMKKIQQAKNFQDLEVVIKDTGEMLKLSHLPDPDKLIAYQNEMRAQTIQQLSRFMLSPKTKLSKSHFNEKSRYCLARILKTAWITDPDEYDFYINEFELLASQDSQ